MIPWILLTALITMIVSLMIGWVFGVTTVAWLLKGSTWKLVDQEGKQVLKWR